MRFLLSLRARRPALAVTLALVGTGMAGVGCGEDEGRPIPTRSARDLVARFDEVERRVDSKACNDVRDDSLPALEKEIEDLPSNVDADLRTTLEDGIGRLTELVEAECVEPPDPAPEETTPEPDPEPEIDPTPTPEPEPEPQPTEPETPTEPDTGGGNDNGGGSGNGNGGGGDNGGGNDGGGSGDNGGKGNGGGDNGGGESGALPPDGGGTGPAGGTTGPGTTAATSAPTPRGTMRA